MKKWALCFLCAMLLFLCGSCRSTKTVIEYLPAEIDIADVVEPIYAMRPDNKVEIILDVQDVADIVTNSAVYLRQWKLWQTYAEGLEKVLMGIQETYGPDKGSPSGSNAEE